MRNILTMLLAGFMLCACSHKLESDAEFKAWLDQAMIVQPEAEQSMPDPASFPEIDYTAMDLLPPFNLERLKIEEAPLDSRCLSGDTVVHAEGKTYAYGCRPFRAEGGNETNGRS